MLFLFGKLNLRRVTDILEKERETELFFFLIPSTQKIASPYPHFFLPGEQHPCVILMCRCGASWEALREVCDICRVPVGYVARRAPPDGGGGREKRWGGSGAAWHEDSFLTSLCRAALNPCRHTRSGPEAVCIHNTLCVIGSVVWKMCKAERHLVPPGGVVSASPPTPDPRNLVYIVKCWQTLN